MSAAATLMPTWLNIIPLLLGGGGLVAIGGILKTWFDHKRGMRKDTDEVAMKLVAQLQERVAAVESSAERERALCDARLAVLRHRLNNISTMFDGLLLLIEAAPDKAASMVEKIKERRALQEAAEAAEKAAVEAAAINAVAAGRHQEATAAAGRMAGVP